MKTRLPILFLLITVALDSIGIGIIMPVMPNLLLELGATDLSQAAIWGGALAAVFSIMQFAFGPMVGNLSDRFGRRPILLASLVVMSLDYLLMGFAGTVWILVIGRVIGGLTAATHPAANAYIADISRPEDKAQNFGLIGAAFGVGFILGPVIGGVLGEYGPRVPFFVAAAIAGGNALFGFIVLKETITDATRRPFEWRRANPIGAFRHIGRLPGQTRLLLVIFAYNIAFFVYPGVWAYYTQEKFGWDSATVGLSLMVFGLSMIISQGVLIRFVIRSVGEQRTVILGMVINILALCAYAVASEGWQIFALTPLAALAILSGPALQGIMSRAAADNQQGELQGLLASINAVALIISPIMMTATFAYFAAKDAPVYFPGAPFLLSAVLIATALLIFAGRQR